MTDNGGWRRDLLRGAADTDETYTQLAATRPSAPPTGSGSTVVFSYFLFFFKETLKKEHGVLG